MAIFEWRKFNFFYLRKDVDEGKVAEALKDAEITCTTNGNNQIIICDSYGCIHVFNRNWEAATFKGHDCAIELCELSRNHNLLITVGNEDNGSLPVFKIWNLSKANKANGGTLPCLRTVKTALQKPTALAISENGMFMAIGFDRGSISLYRGDISRDRSKVLKTISGGITPITGIVFKTYGKTVQMFVCSDSGVLVYNVQQKDKEIKTVLDKNCEPIRCCALQTTQISSEAHFMVGRDDAVYCYTTDGRGPCYALDGEKSIIQWFRSHLLTISKPTKNALGSQKESTLTVIDILNKFIVYSAQLDTVSAILIEFGTCFVVTTSKTIYHLDEKDLQSKLNLLFKKNLYDIAVRIAKSSEYANEGLADIFKQYGDHLYSKGDFAGAVEQYAKTIGFLEPSYVIRRFLDSRHINYLTDYLQVLHKHGQASAEHTTLLLNCFTRLDKTDQLKEFLGNDRKSDILFDLDVAIKVCRNASTEHALSLAKRHQRHDFCISILTEDMKSYSEALDYISNLPFADAEETIKKYGNILMENCPNETTNLLKMLCTDYQPKSKLSIGNGDDGLMVKTDFFDSSAHIDRANPEDFIHLFVKSSAQLLIEFLEHLVKNVNNCSPLVYNTLIEHYIRCWKTDKRAEEQLIEILKSNKNSDHLATYDRDHVLILCSMYDFLPGIMHIYEDQQLYHLIVRHYLKAGDFNNLIKCCKRLGTNQPSLWLQALTGLRENKNAPSNLLTQVLQVIAQEKLQSPLQVLTCLAIDGGPNLSSVRDYFFQVFQRDNESSKNEEELVEKYRHDSVALRAHIKNLQENLVEFRGTLCKTCHQPLSIPAIYFLCQHSYHQDCLRGYSENDKDCPVCHAKNTQLVNALRAQSESRGQHEVFHNLLDRSIEPFSVVAEYFGRGIFNEIVIVEEEDDSQGEINRNTVEKSEHPSTTMKNPFNVEPSRIVPIPEGRMRKQESSRYSTSLEAHISRAQSYRRPPENSSIIKPSSVVPRTDPGIPAASIPKRVEISKDPKNPFDEVDDEADKNYDESKNPFADDPEPKSTKESAGDAKKLNPFDEYDNNLNPFS